MNRQTRACILVAVCLAGGCSQESEQAADARTAVQTHLAAEKARLDAMTPEERTAEEKREAEAKAEQRKRREAELRLAQWAQLRAEGLIWNYRTSPDELSGKPVETAWVKSENTVEFDSPYQGAQRGTLSLRKHPRHGHDVVLQLERGQFLCGIDECSVSVRVDDGPVQQFSVAEAADQSTETLFIRNYSRFVKQITGAKEVRIAATVYQEGTPTFVFNVEGLEWK